MPSRLFLHTALVQAETALADAANMFAQADSERSRRLNEMVDEVYAMRESFVSETGGEPVRPSHQTVRKPRRFVPGGR